MSPEEYILDTPVVRGFIDAVRAHIDASSSAGDAVERIRPDFAELLADPDWLPAVYREPSPESGMGGGIGRQFGSPRVGYVHGLRWHIR